MLECSILKKSLEIYHKVQLGIDVWTKCVYHPACFTCDIWLITKDTLDKCVFMDHANCESISNVQYWLDWLDYWFLECNLTSYTKHILYCLHLVIEIFNFVLYNNVLSNCSKLLILKPSTWTWHLVANHQILLKKIICIKLYMGVNYPTSPIVWNIIES